VAFSPNGKLLASGSEDNTIRLWDVASRQPLSPDLTGHKGPVNCVAFSSDGKILASGCPKGTIILWDLKNGKPLGPPMQGGYVQTIAFSHDGKILASGNSEEGAVLLWDVRTRQTLGPPLKGGPLPHITSVSFSPDGKILASGYADGVIILWDTENRQPLGTSGTPIKEAYHRESPTKFFSQKWLERACVMANRNFSKYGWEQYMGDRPYRKTCPNLPGPEEEKPSEAPPSK
jgi:WD40 repeat protein